MSNYAIKKSFSLSRFSCNNKKTPNTIFSYLVLDPDIRVSDGLLAKEEIKGGGWGGGLYGFTKSFSSLENV